MADAMSPGELCMTAMAGFDKSNTCYVCNNVSSEELRHAYDSCLHVSVDSLSQVETFGQTIPGGNIMVRLNPFIGAGHNKKVITAGSATKFGINESDLPELRKILKKYDLKLIGLNQHIGSLFLDSTNYLAAVTWLLNVARQFPEIQVLDFGGGFGIPYHKLNSQPRLDIADLQEKLSNLILTWCKETGYEGKFCIEPGRYIVAECGILLGAVHAIKKNGPARYVGTDIGFTTLVRPALYDAYHEVELIQADTTPREKIPQTVVGNICETGDIIAENRLLTKAEKGDLVAVLDAGAYCQSMSSNYNQRFRPAELLIAENGEVRCIRRRDSAEDIIRPYLA